GTWVGIREASSRRVISRSRRCLAFNCKDVGGAMNAQELYRAVRLAEAITALGAEVRDNPTDPRRRTFLFELLCFAGEYARADKQLEVLGQGGPTSEMGVLLYRSALYSERQRQELFARDKNPRPEDTPTSFCGGVLNGKG